MTLSFSEIEQVLPVHPAPVAPLAQDAIASGKLTADLDPSASGLEVHLLKETEVEVEGSVRPSCTTQSQQNQGLKVFLSTFVTIFLAELGDKTQLTTLLMSAESQAPWVVFAGAGAALIATSLLGVLVGRWLSTRISAETLETSAGTVLLLIAVLLLWDVVHL